MHNLTLNQTLSLWGQLIEAYYGVNGFGGDVAEIYLFSAMLHSPSAERGNRKARDLVITTALDSLNALFDKFTKDWECTLEVDGRPWSKAHPLHDMDATRFHVRVVRPTRR